MRLHGTSVVTFLALLFTVWCFMYGAFMYWGRGQYLLAMLFIISAGVFGIAAIGRFRHAPFVARTADEIAECKTHGKMILTTFMSMDRRWNVQVNGKSPVVIYSQGIDPDTKQARMFESEDLWFAEGDASTYRDPLFQSWQRLQGADAPGGFLIPVYLDLKNTRRYFMDVADARRIQTKKENAPVSGGV